VLDRWGITETAPAPDPREDPAAVEPPPGLELPAPAAPRLVAAPLKPSEPDAAAVRRALDGLLDDKRLGRRVTVSVSGVDGKPVVTEGPSVVTPASTMKLLTSLAALEVLGPEHRFATSVVGSGRDITLVGGGDPLLASHPVGPGSYPAQADIVTLARATAERLRADGHHLVRLSYDDSLFSGPEASPFWEPDYLSTDVVTPITALWVDQGVLVPGQEYRSSDPAGDAAGAFATALRKAGIKVVGPVRHAEAPEDAEQLAVVRGAELVEVVQQILEVSDNEGAEVLARHVALAEGKPGSFAAAGPAVESIVRDLGVPLPGAVVHDGSGLARSDRLDVRTLLGVLSVSAEHHDPDLGGVVEGLPVAGFTGSLSYRFTNGADAGLGWVRAKTGTLTGVSGYAGTVTASDGTPMLFVMVADRVPDSGEAVLFTRDRLDQVAAALAGCACGR
jgi:D-alanyl-D-alanine carboxypeptidase/D-alanyl-D-alanine-endopeptidase (penicillin-binding protein 4)